MTQRTIIVPEIGEVVLSRRRGTSHLRISINAAGKVRVAMPYWAPYNSGIAFVNSKSSWIQKHLAKRPNTRLQNGDLIGKSHRVVYLYKPEIHKTTIRVTANQIITSSDLPLSNQYVQSKLMAACEKALKAQAINLLPQRLRFLAAKNSFICEEVRIRKLTARWGSCSSKGVITLSYYLLQLPWNLIDYVILHELIHTRHLHHGPDFWDEFNKVLPSAKSLQKQIRTYQPLVQAYQTARD